MQLAIDKMRRGTGGFDARMLSRTNRVIAGQGRRSRHARRITAAGNRLSLSARQRLIQLLRESERGDRPRSVKTRCQSLACAFCLPPAFRDAGDPAFGFDDPHHALHPSSGLFVETGEFGQAYRAMPDRGVEHPR